VTPHKFAIVPEEFIRDRRVSDQQRRVYLALALHADDQGECFPSRALLAEIAGLPEGKVSVATTALQELGYIQKQGDGGRSMATRYLLLRGKTVPESGTVTDSGTVTGSETLTESVTVRAETVPESVTVSPQKTVPESETVTESVTKTVTESVRGKEQTKEQTKENPKPTLPLGRESERRRPEATNPGGDGPHDGDARDEQATECRATTSVQDSRFDRFWAAYPRKISKGHARKAWDKIKPDEQLLARMLAAIGRAKTSAQWRKDDGQYIPHPATWLNGERWEDDHDGGDGRVAEGARSLGIPGLV